MIGCKAHPKHPDDPSRCVFVPLFYDRHTGECVPILGPEGSKDTEMGAARACFEESLIDWLEVMRMTRMVYELDPETRFMVPVRAIVSDQRDAVAGYAAGPLRPHVGAESP